MFSASSRDCRTTCFGKEEAGAPSASLLVLKGAADLE